MNLGVKNILGKMQYKINNKKYKYILRSVRSNYYK